MSHCPQCGEATPEGARACPFCGSPLAAQARAPAPASRTIVGVSTREVIQAETDRAGAPPAFVPPAPPAGGPKASRTIVGMPASALSGALGAKETPRPSAQPARGAMPLRVGQT